MEEKKKDGFYKTILLIVLGSVLTIAGSVVSELWLIPAKQEKLRRQEIAEMKFSRLYAPLILATGKGELSMASDLVFYRVQDIMERYGYLGSPELIDRYIQFVMDCQFASYEELRSGGLMTKPLPKEVIVEIVKQRKPPLAWSAGSLEDALESEKSSKRFFWKSTRPSVKDTS